MTPGGTITSKKPIKQSNPARIAKRDREYQRKLALYRRSETHRIVEERAQGVCEFYVAIIGGIRVARVGERFGYVRCENAEVGHHHAKGYARLGGRERPDEMVAGCSQCHDYVESLKLVHRARRSAT